MVSTRDMRTEVSVLDVNRPIGGHGVPANGKPMNVLMSENLFGDLGQKATTSATQSMLLAYEPARAAFPEPASDPQRPVPRESAFEQTLNERIDSLDRQASRPEPERPDAESRQDSTDQREQRPRHDREAIRERQEADPVHADEESTSSAAREQSQAGRPAADQPPREDGKGRSTRQPQQEVGQQGPLHGQVGVEVPKRAALLMQSRTTPTDADPTKKSKGVKQDLGKNVAIDPMKVSAGKMDKPGSPASQPFKTQGVTQVEAVLSESQGRADDHQPSGKAKTEAQFALTNQKQAAVKGGAVTLKADAGGTVTATLPERGRQAHHPTSVIGNPDRAGQPPVAGGKPTLVPDTAGETTLNPRPLLQTAATSTPSHAGFTLSHTSSDERGGQHKREGTSTASAGKAVPAQAQNSPVGQGRIDLEGLKLQTPAHQQKSAAPVKPPAADAAESGPFQPKDHAEGNPPRNGESWAARAAGAHRYLAGPRAKLTPSPSTIAPTNVTTPLGSAAEPTTPAANPATSAAPANPLLSSAVETGPLSEAPLTRAAPAKGADVPTDLLSTKDLSASVSKQIMESIHSSVQQGQRRLTITLQPAELGRVVVKLEEQGGQLSGLLEVTQKQTRAEIERALPGIMQSLQSSGVQIKRLDVTLGNNGNESGARDSSWNEPSSDSSSSQHSRHGRQDRQDAQPTGPFGFAEGGVGAETRPTGYASSSSTILGANDSINMLA